MAGSAEFCGRARLDDKAPQPFTATAPARGRTSLALDDPWPRNRSRRDSSTHGEDHRRTSSNRPRTLRARHRIEPRSRRPGESDCRSQPDEIAADALPETTCRSASQSHRRRRRANPRRLKVSRPVTCNTASRPLAAAQRPCGPRPPATSNIRPRRPSAPMPRPGTSASGTPPSRNGVRNGCNGSKSPAVRAAATRCRRTAKWPTAPSRCATHSATPIIQLECRRPSAAGGHGIEAERKRQHAKNAHRHDHRPRPPASPARWPARRKATLMEVRRRRRQGGEPGDHRGKGDGRDLAPPTGRRPAPADAVPACGNGDPQR